MRPAHPPPEGRLPFGPAGLSLSEAFFGQMVVGGRGGFGYESVMGRTADPTDLLDWTITARLQLLNPGGKVQRLVEQHHWRIMSARTLDGRPFTVRVNGPPGSLSIRA